MKKSKKIPQRRLQGEERRPQPPPPAGKAFARTFWTIILT
jgi:hypothetical protein